LFFQIVFGGVMFGLPGATQEVSRLSLTRWEMEALGSSTNLERLDSLTRTRFQPDPISEDLAVPVEWPAPGWEPISVVTVTQEIEVPISPGIAQTVVISVPQLVYNEPVTTTRVIRQEITVEPDPVDIFNPQGFRIPYTRTREHLLITWGVLIGMGLLFAAGTVIVLEKKDVW